MKIFKKGKSFPIGTIHNGYKKVGEGKWQKVSEKGKTKKEHEEEVEKQRKGGNNNEAYKQHIISTNIDDKEHDEEELGGGEKKFDYTFFDDYKLTGKERDLVLDIKNGKKDIDELMDLHDNSSNIDQKARTYILSFLR